MPVRSANFRSRPRRLIALTALLAVIAPSPAVAFAQRSTPPVRRAAPRAPAAKQVAPATYWVYVGAESADAIYRIRFDGKDATVEKTIRVGELAAEMEGPHGLQISPDQKYLYMTTGHGFPDGKLWKYELGPDTLVNEPTLLGFFPATVDVTPDGLFTYSANFNLHGEMVPSSISVVYTPTNTEVAQTVTCVMPHGSRLNSAGTRHYSGCMMDDMLVEINTRNHQVSAKFSLAQGKEGLVKENAARAGMDHSMHGGAPMANTCSPTWAQPAASGSMVYVACNKSDEVIEVDASTWNITRRFKTGAGPYNMAVTADGKFLVITLKKGAGLEMIDLTTGQSVYRDKLSTTIGHGVAVSPDSRYAFVSVEGVGAEPGKVDVFDLTAKRRVSSVEVGQQASGIAFWKMEAAVKE